MLSRERHGFPPCHSGVFPLDHEPVVTVDLIGVEPITPILQGSVASIGIQAHRFQEVRPGIEPGLPPYHSGVRPKHLQTLSSKVIPAGIETPHARRHVSIPLEIDTPNAA
jgi:hypothetical protein